MWTFLRGFDRPSKQSARRCFHWQLSRVILTVKKTFVMDFVVLQIFLVRMSLEATFVMDISFNFFFFFYIKGIENEEDKLLRKNLVKFIKYSWKTKRHIVCMCARARGICWLYRVSISSLTSCTISIGKYVEQFKSWTEYMFEFPSFTLFKY